jgi:hypothetical protein
VTTKALNPQEVLVSAFGEEGPQRPLYCPQCNEVMEDGEEEVSPCGFMHAECFDEHCAACEACRRDY